MKIDQRAIVQKRLRETIADLVGGNGDWPPEVKEVVLNRLSNATPEALTGWLNDGGWEVVDKEKLEARIIAAYRWARDEHPGQQIPCCDTIAKTYKTYSLQRGSRVEIRRFTLVESAQDIEGLEIDISPKPERFTLTDEMGAIIGHSISILVDDEKPGDIKVSPPVETIRWCLDSNHWLPLSIGIWCAAETRNREADWLRWLAGYWVRGVGEDVIREFQRIQESKPLLIRARAKDKREERYIPIDLAMQEAGGILGGGARVDNELYADTAEPVSTPIACDIASIKRLDNPRQRLIPGVIQSDPLVSEFLLVTATQNIKRDALPPLVAKMLPLQFAICRGPQLVRGTLQELTELLYPKTKRIQRREREHAAAALVASGAIRMFELKDNGTFHPYRIFDVDYDLSTEPGAKVGITMNPWFIDRMSKGGIGYYLVNIDRLLALPTNKPALIALYLYLAGYWHKTGRQKGVFYPSRCAEGLDLFDIATTINALSPTALEYLSQEKGDRRAPSKDKERLVSGLKELQEQGLIGKLEIKGRGDKQKAIIQPDAGYIEACKRAVQNRR